MRKLLLNALLVVAAAGPASAAGINLSWVDCGAAGTLNRTFACDTNSGSNVLVASFVAPTGLSQVTGMASIVDLEFASPTLPAWWDFGGCRLVSSIVHSSNFEFFPGSCLDYFRGGASGAGVYLKYGHPEVTAPNRARIKEGWALPAGSPLIGPIASDVEVYAFNIIIFNTRTTGLGSCAGCQTRATIVFNYILVTNVPGDPNGNKTLVNPAARAFVTWQDGTTPAKSRTWGSVKSLYR